MSALNAWLNPFSSDYRAAVSDFDKIDGPKQVLVVAVSLLCGVAFLVGGVAAFRGMVTWLKPGDSQGADKVDDLVHSKRPFHPAETPSDSEDRLSSLPAEVLTLIAGNLDNQSLRRLGVTSKDLLDNSGEGYKKEVKQLLGATLATEMRQRRSSWREVLLDFRRPFQPSLGSLSVLGVEDSGWGDKPVLNAVLDAIRKNDEGALDRNLQQLQREGNLNQLNSRYFGKTALEVAAINGHVKMAEILISYGAKDALGGKHYNSSHGVKGYSALFWAAHKGRIEMVRFLLDKGASPSWILEQDGFDRPFLEKLVGEQRDESYDVLECILLLVNAWKGASGSEVVSEDKSAIQAFNGAINRGHADTARLLYALGIRPEISREMIDKIVLRSLQTKNLTMIKFLHEYNLVDFKILRSSSGETLLHQAYAVAAMDILQYLIDEAGVPKDATNSAGETYAVYGKRVLEPSIRRVIVNQLNTFGTYMDNKSGLRMDSLEECLQHKIDLNVPINEEGQTILHLAAMQICHSGRNIEGGTLDLLLRHGAKANIQDTNGDTPLAIAQKTLLKEKKKGYAGDDNISRAKQLIKQMESQ